MDMTHDDLIVRTFRAAAEAAKKAAALDRDDGGTCNFDAPAFRIARFAPSTIERLAIQAGLRATSFTWFRQTWYFLEVGLEGQGALRSRMSKAAHDVLRSLQGQVPGFEARHYQQMD